MMDETTIRVAIRATARISFVLSLGVFLGDALYRLIPAAATRWLKANKDGIGRICYLCERTLWTLGLGPKHCGQRSILSSLLSPQLSQLLQTGDYTSVRRLFAFFRVNECVWRFFTNHELHPTVTELCMMAAGCQNLGTPNNYFARHL
jgi:hypothetical protein